MKATTKFAGESDQANGGDDGAAAAVEGGDGAAVAAKAAAEVDAALPCGHYSECKPSPLVVALFFNCAIAYIFFTVDGMEILPPYVEVGLKAMPLASLFAWSLLETQITVPRLLLSAALFFSMLGDVVLESKRLGVEAKVELEVAGNTLGFFELGAAAFGAYGVCCVRCARA